MRDDCLWGRMFQPSKRNLTYLIYRMLFVMQNLDRTIGTSRVVAIYLAPRCRQGFDVAVDGGKHEKGSTLVSVTRHIM